MPTSPSRVDANASVLPSGLQAGSTSVVLPLLIGVSVDEDSVSWTRPASPYCVVTKTSASPAGDHVGFSSSTPSGPRPAVAAVAFVPVPVDVQILLLPETEVTNARWVPSG